MADQIQDLTKLPLVYTNHIRMAISFTDFRIFFGEAFPTLVSESGLQEKPISAKAVDRVCVIISPDLVQSLLDALTKGLKTYEAQFGPLRKVPPSSQPKQQKPPTPDQP